MSAYHDAHMRDAADRIALQLRRIADNLERLANSAAARDHAERQRLDAILSADVLPFRRPQ